MISQKSLLLQRVEKAELRKRALDLKLCPICGDPLKEYREDLSLNEPEKKGRKYTYKSGYRGWYNIKQCSSSDFHYYDEKYDQVDDDDY